MLPQVARKTNQLVDGADKLPAKTALWIDTNVAAALRELSGLGIDRVQLTELVPGSHARLAGHLL